MNLSEVASAGQLGSPVDCVSFSRVVLKVGRVLRKSAQKLVITLKAYAQN